MKSIYVLLFVVLATALMLSACVTTPFDQAVAVIKNDGSTHIIAAKQVDSSGSTAYGYCPSWTHYSIFARCDQIAQSFRKSDIGPINNPTDIPIVKYDIGELELQNARVLKSWGLSWTDDHGNPVDTADFVEGVFYTFKVNSDQIHGFDLVQK